jgi:cell pole-organizing protein PopZ
MSDAEQEPSMEEILASIRRIISDDNEQVETTEEQAAVEEIVPQEEVVQAVEDPLPVEELPAPTPDEDEDEDEDEDDEVLDLTDMDAADPEPLFEEQAYQAPVSPSPAPAPEPIQQPTPSPVEEKESLVSTPQAVETMDEFARLGSKLYEDVQELPIGNGAVTLEGLVRELVRPMLKEWLDQHLPITVERLVREEIERLVMQSQRKDPW